MRKAMGAKAGLLHGVLKAPFCGQRNVVDFEGSWATAWMGDKLPKGVGGQETPLELQGGGQHQVLGGEVDIDLL